MKQKMKSIGMRTKLKIKSIGIRALCAAAALAVALGSAMPAFADDYEEPSYSVPGFAAEAAAEAPDGTGAAGSGEPGISGQSQTLPGTLRYEDIEELVMGSSGSQLLDKKLKALQDPANMTIFTRDSVVYQIKLSKVEKEKAAAEMVRAAQQAYTGILRLDDGLKSLAGAREAAERVLASLEILSRYGMASGLQLSEARHALDEIAEKTETAEAKREQLARQLGFLCGEGSAASAVQTPAGTDGTRTTPGSMYPAGMPLMPAPEEITAFDCEKDMPAALAASFDVRLKKEAISYAEGFQGERSETAAKADRANTEEEFRIAFRSAYRAISEKQLALSSAESALKLEEERLKSAELQHSKGMLSKYALLDRQYALEEAERAVTAARLDLLEAVEVYRRMKGGLSPQSEE